MPLAPAEELLIRTAAALSVRNTLYFAGWDIMSEEARLCDALLARHPLATPHTGPAR